MTVAPTFCDHTEWREWVAFQQTVLTMTFPSWVCGPLSLPQGLSEKHPALWLVHQQWLDCFQTAQTSHWPLFTCSQCAPRNASQGPISSELPEEAKGIKVVGFLLRDAQGSGGSWDQFPLGQWHGLLYTERLPCLLWSYFWSSCPLSHCAGLSMIWWPQAHSTSWGHECK